jgi:hypothetical protein
MRRISVLALVLLTGLISAQLPHALARSQHQITTFDVPGGGTGPGQGTIVNGITADGSVTGWYKDTNNVNHGFLRSSNGNITKFDVPGAGTARTHIAWRRAIYPRSLLVHGRNPHARLVEEASDPSEYPETASARLNVHNFPFREVSPITRPL